MKTRDKRKMKTRDRYKGRYGIKIRNENGG
jgi:hypothetical protein